MSKASKKTRKSGASRDETEALADYLARLAPFVDDGENPTATRTARRALRHYTAERQNFLSSLGLDSNMSFPQALNRAVNIVHQLEDDLGVARKELDDTKARNNTLVKNNTTLQKENTNLKECVQALDEQLDSVQTECNSHKTGINELKTRNEELQAHNEELQRRNKELEQEVNKLVERNNGLQATSHALEDAYTELQRAHNTLAEDKRHIEMVAKNRARQLDTEYDSTKISREKYETIMEQLLCRDRERRDAKALIKRFEETWTDLVKGWEDVCGNRADCRFKYGVSDVWKYLCYNIWCPETPLPSDKAADSIHRYCPPVAGHKNADLRTRVRGIVDQASDLRNELEKSQFRVHINPSPVRLEQDPYLSPTVVIFTSFGFAESLGHCNVPRTHPEAISRDAAV